MKKAFYAIAVLFFVNSLFAQTGVGIGTASPKALLHVDGGAVVFSGSSNDNALDNNVSGAGTRFLWYPKRAALRAGIVENIHSANWDKDSIGFGSVALGNNTKATGFVSFATNYLTAASGDASFAAGISTHAQGSYSTAFGNSTKAGYLAFAAGSHSTASGHTSLAIGQYNQATMYQSVAIGSYLMSKAENGTVIGTYNNTADNPTSAPMPTDRLFQIGNGTDENTRSNALTILRNGNTGIGELTPDARLHITHNSGLSLPHLLLEEPQNDYARLSFKNTNTANVWSVAASPATTNATAQLNIFWQGYGDILKIYGTGNAILAGSLTENSDARLKTNISPLSNPLTSLQKLSGYRYQWKDKARDPAIQIGLLAQEVQSVFPELVKEDEKGTLSVNYSGLVPVLIDAVKEQQREIDTLKKQMQQMMSHASK